MNHYARTNDVVEFLEIRGCVPLLRPLFLVPAMAKFDSIVSRGLSPGVANCVSAA
jgi:hypothetical protein